MPESSALRYLATLAGRGVVEHDGNGADSRYRLGIALFSLAERALGNTDVRALALPLMQGLLDRFQETVNLAIFRQRRLVIIESLEGLRSIRQGARVGEQDRLRSTALGKAILATYADNEALALLRAEPVERLTARTITSNDAMLDELRCGTGAGLCHRQRRERGRPPLRRRRHNQPAGAGICHVDQRPGQSLPSSGRTRRGRRLPVPAWS